VINFKLLIVNEDNIIYTKLDLETDPTGNKNFKAG
jgi:hypothetical protein